MKRDDQKRKICYSHLYITYAHTRINNHSYERKNGKHTLHIYIFDYLKGKLKRPLRMYLIAHSKETCSRENGTILSLNIRKSVQPNLKTIET